MTGYTRDPRINPEPGDVIRQRGKTIVIDEYEPDRPALVHCFVDTKPWKMGLFVFQGAAKGAEVVIGEEAAHAIAAVNSALRSAR